ncbi:MAG TPA: hypothetical protein VJN43_19315 [Bryobacteraceae bacterium]|nr:hypothetical protein [Bryobacteraceae bacterium]
MVHFPRKLRLLFGAAVVICTLVAIPAVLAQSPGIKLTVLEGQGAINNIEQHRAKEPVVQVMEDEKPVAGATVTFQLPETGASGYFATNRVLTIQTDAKGQAVGRGLHPNSTAGRFQIRVTASFHGETANAVIYQINAQPAGAAKGGGGKKFLIIALVGGAAAGGLFAAKGSGKSGSSPVSSPVSTGGTVLVPGSPVLQPPH